jgi:hypothetical protein
MGELEAGGEGEMVGVAHGLGPGVGQMVLRVA